MGDWDGLCGCRKPNKPMKRMDSPVKAGGQDGSSCGIGVVFRMDAHSALVVDSLVPGGPAWDSAAKGGLQVGDVLQSIDGKNVYRWKVNLLAPLLLGPEGTIVRLGVQRSIHSDSINGGTPASSHRPQSPGSEVLKSVIIDIQRKRFSPPPEPYSASRPPIVDARRGMPEGGAPTAMGTPVGNNVRKSSTGETFTAA